MKKLDLPIVYYESKLRLFKILIVAMAFLAVSILAMPPDYINGDWHSYNVVKLKVILPLSIIICGGAVIFALYGIINRRKLFTVAVKGITPKNTRLILWSEIAEFRVTTQKIGRRSTIESVGIFLKDVNSYCESLSPIKKKLAKLNIGIVGTPLVLNTNLGNIDPAALAAELNDYLKRYRSY